MENIEKFIEVDDDNRCTAPIMADKDILELLQILKNIIDADSDYENEMNNAAHGPMLSEMRNIMKTDTGRQMGEKNVRSESTSGWEESY
ncbi:hypothetical protein TNCV_1480631 [Trichonephila clavipes]|nr:hypothetical protein TNCV_1480631 [Trichonephila clavipes]